MEIDRTSEKIVIDVITTDGKTITINNDTYTPSKGEVVTIDPAFWKWFKTIQHSIEDADKEEKKFSFKLPEGTEDDMVKIIKLYDIHKKIMAAKEAKKLEEETKKEIKNSKIEAKKDDEDEDHVPIETIAINTNEMKIRGLQNKEIDDLLRSTMSPVPTRPLTLDEVRKLRNEKEQIFRLAAIADYLDCEDLAIYVNPPAETDFTAKNRPKISIGSAVWGSPLEDLGAGVTYADDAKTLVMYNKGKIGRIGYLARRIPKGPHTEQFKQRFGADFESDMFDVLNYKGTGKPNPYWVLCEREINTTQYEIMHPGVKVNPNWKDKYPEITSI